MTDENTGIASSAEANQETQPTQTGNHDGYIPKYRLDEEIAKRRAYEEQNQILSQTLRQVTSAPQQNQVPEKEPEYMLRLKEENPTAYQAQKATMAQLAQLKRANQQQAASQFELHEQLDRKQLVDNFGEDASTKLSQIESIIEQERRRGNFHVNRGIIYQNLRGAEAIENSRKKPNQQTQTTNVAPVQTQTVYSSDVPSS